MKKYLRIAQELIWGIIDISIKIIPREINWLAKSLSNLAFRETPIHVQFVEKSLSSVIEPTHVLNIEEQQLDDRNQEPRNKHNLGWMWNWGDQHRTVNSK